MKVMKPESKWEKDMPNITVSKSGNKYKVLINFIQRGIDYSSQALAEAEANKIREQYQEVISKR